MHTSQSLLCVRRKLREFGFRGALFLSGCVLLLTVGVFGQAAPILRPIVTDQTPLPLSNLFQETTGQINQAHDFAFIAKDGSALFLRRAGASAPARIIQRGDPVPGVSGSWFSGISTPLFVTGPRPGPQPGMVAFKATFYVSGSSRSGIFAYDGSSIHSLVLSTDIAPGSSGLSFTDLQLVGANDSGDIAFIALTTKSADSLFILPAGETPLRVVGKGDTLPGTAGTVSGFSHPLSMNARGEVAFLCGFSTGNKEGIFVGSRSGIRKIAATGDSRPGGGTFGILSSSLLLNNAGVVVFQNEPNSSFSTTWINTPGIGTERIFEGGDPLVLNDSGQVLLAAGDRLVRINADRTVETVAEVGQTAPGASGDTFASFYTASSVKGAMNNAGDVAFVGLGAQDKPLGVFQKSGTDELKAVALNGAPASIEGETLEFQNTSLKILDDGSVQFSARVAGGADDSAQLLSTASGLQTLVSTADPLPAGERVSFLGAVAAAGDYVAFAARFNAGRQTLFLHNNVTGATTPVVTSGDSAPGTSGRLRLDSAPYFVNSSGQVALFATVVEDGSLSDPMGVFLSDPERGLQKIAVVGDIEATSGMHIGTISIPGIWRSRSPLNSKGQVVFAASLSDTWTSRSGLLVGSIDEGVKKVILDYDPLPGGDTFPSIYVWDLKSFFINDAGRVAFSSWNLSNYTQAAIFTAAPGEAPVKIVQYGDPGPSGAFYSLTEPLSFNDSGQVLFSAQTAVSIGLFLGAAGATPQPVALQGQTVPGEDSLSFGPFLTSVLGNNGGVMNKAGTVVFPAQLAGSSGSGFFLRSGTDLNTRAVFLQGQTVPGTSDAFGPVSDYYARFYGLDDSGFVYALNAIGDSNIGLVRYRPNRVLEKVLVSGETAPDGGGTVVSIYPPLYNSAVSKPPFWVGMFGGTISEAIYMPLLPSLQTDTSSLGFTSVDGASPEAQSFTISNAGGVEDLNWAATVSDPWISLDATSGTAPSSVKVSINVAGLSVGAHHGTITITCGAADGSPQSISVTLTVLPALSITWPTPDAIAYGTPLSGTQLNATASLPGAFVYTPEAGTVLGAGNHTLSAAFTPAETDNYAAVTSTVSLTVNKATPSIHWSAPVAITSGTALSDVQLNATADVPGAFVYTPSKGTVLDAGAQTLSVRFIPTDTSNYTEATAIVSLKVNAPEVLTPVITGLTPALIKAGSSGFNLVVSGTGFGSGATVLWNGSARTTTVVSGGLQAEVAAADIASPGTVNITVANPASLGGIASAQYKFVIDTAATTSGSFAVTAPATVTVEPGKDTQVPVTLAGISSGATVTATCVNLPAGVSFSYKDGVLTFTTSPDTPRGTYTIVATFTATTQTTAMGRSGNRYLALWLGLGGLPLGLLWAGGSGRKTAGRCAMIFGGLLLILALASCGGGSTANNQSGSPSTPSSPVSRQSSVVMTLTVR